MLIEISGEHTGSVVMFGTVAVQLLKMMGQSGNTEGAIRAPDVPAALQNLVEALEQTPADNQTNEDEEGDTHVSLHTRAKPLIDLLQECVTDKGYVMWQPK